MSRNHILTLSVHIILFLLIAAGCGERKVESLWRDRPIAIDGRDDGDEWKGSRYFLEEEKIVLGIMNDDTSLYLRFSCLDRSTVRNIVAGGFIVWMDGAGTKKKSFGILFPPSSMGGRPPDGGARSRNESPDIEAENRMQPGNSLSGDIFVVGDGGKSGSRLTIDQGAEIGLFSRVGAAGDRIVYELAVPLMRHEDRPYGISLKKTDSITVTLAAGRLSFGGRSPQGSDGRSGGGMGDDGMGSGGMGGGMDGSMGGRGGRSGMGRRPPGMSSMSEPLELKLAVQLAQNAAGE